MTTSTVTVSTTTTTTTIKSQGRGRSNSLPTHVVEYLKAWLMDHMHHPYPTDQEKAEMMLKTGIDVKRLNNWFVNNRIRYWKPRMEAIQRQQNQRKESTISTLPLPGPYTRIVSSIVKDVLPVQVTTTHQDYPQQTSLNQSLPSTTPLAPPSSLLVKASTPVSCPSPSIVSDASASDEGEWSDGGSVRSKEDLVIRTSSSSSSSPSTTVTPSPKVSRKRVLDDTITLTMTTIPTPSRTKFSRKDELLWRDVCLSSQQVNDSTLPTLDEAALLFGFATSH